MTQVKRFVIKSLTKKHKNYFAKNFIIKLIAKNWYMY